MNSSDGIAPSLLAQSRFEIINLRLHRATCLLLALLFHASTPFLIGLLLLTMGGYQVDLMK